MTMREDCKYFQVRTTPTGDRARFCALDLAPEAPWRCPENCPRYSRRVGEPGSGRAGQGEATSVGVPEPGEGAAAVLGSATDIINAASPVLQAEERRRRAAEARARAQEPGWWERLRRRGRRDGG